MHIGLTSHHHWGHIMARGSCGKGGRSRNKDGRILKPSSSTSQFYNFPYERLSKPMSQLSPSPPPVHASDCNCPRGLTFPQLVDAHRNSLLTTLSRFSGRKKTTPKQTCFSKRYNPRTFTDGGVCSLVHYCTNPLSL